MLLVYKAVYKVINTCFPPLINNALLHVWERNVCAAAVMVRGRWGGLLERGGGVQIDVWANFRRAASLSGCRFHIAGAAMTRL